MPPERIRSHAATADDERVRELLSEDIDIRIARDGTWHHEGRPIRRMALVKLFAGILRYEDDGEYYLRTPLEKRRIRVDDAPFVAVESTIEGEGEACMVHFRTNVEDHVTADADHPVRIAIDPETRLPLPYVHVRDGLEALIARPVYYDLVNSGRIAWQDGREVLGIDSCGCFFVLGETHDDAG